MKSFLLQENLALIHVTVIGEGVIAVPANVGVQEMATTTIKIRELQQSWGQEELFTEIFFRNKLRQPSGNVYKQLIQKIPKSLNKPRLAGLSMVLSENDIVPNRFCLQDGLSETGSSGGFHPDQK